MDRRLFNKKRVKTKKEILETIKLIGDGIPKGQLLVQELYDAIEDNLVDKDEFLENDDKNVRHMADCERIVRIASQCGVSIPLSRAEKIWEEYSETYAAGWLGLGSDAEVRTIIQSYINKIINEHTY